MEICYNTFGCIWLLKGDKRIMSYIRTKAIYLSVSLVIFIPLFLLNFYHAIEDHDTQIEARKIRTDEIAMQASKLMMITASGEHEEALLQIAALFAPIYEIGYYSQAEDRYIYNPDSHDPHRIGEWIRSQPAADSQASIELLHHHNITMARPLMIDETLVGYICISFPVDDLATQFNRKLIISFVTIGMVWILVLLLIRALAARFNHALEILSYQVQIDEAEQDIGHVYPDIQPILERINRKNSDLRNMAHKYLNEAYKMKQLMDMAPLGILSVDEKGTITACNTTYAQYYPEFDKDRLPGMNILTLAERSRMPEVEQSIEQALAGMPTNANTYIYDQKVLLVYAYPIYNENNVISGALGICQDITEIEKLRNELHRMDRLHIIGQMAASFAHEVRNPLTVIRGFMQLMQRQMDPHKMHDYLDMVINELDRSNEIIGNFLSLSQNRFLQKEKINLNRIIEEIETLLLAEANHSNIELVLHKDSNLRELMLNDKEIKQLILNLTRNAVESMHSGGKLYIRTMQVGDTAVLEVQDTGHGIPPHKLDRLFEPFYTTKSSGTGLGLAVCLSIVEQHQAKISVQSEEDNGTTFTIHFNVTDASRHAG